MLPARQPMRMLSKCASCGAAIVWAITTRGKPIPIDPQPADGGNIMLARQIDAQLVAIVAHNGDAQTEPRYVSHFVTCPNAADFRRSRKRSGQMRQS